MLAERQAHGSEMFWTLVAWGGGLLAAIVVFFIGQMIEGAPTGLVFAGVAFIVVGFVLSRLLGPAPAPDDAAPAHTHAAAAHHHGEVAPVAVAEPVEHDAVHRERAPAADVAEAPLGGISERVRQAARAAGEAARAAGVHGGGGVPSPVMGEGVPPRPDPDPLPPGPVPPEPVPVPPEPVPPMSAAAGAGARPTGLDAPRGGRADDLKRIKGVGPKIEAILHGNGIYHFDQIAAWGPAELTWIDANLDAFSGRALREDWVGQARILAGGGETEHSRQVDRGEAT
jgi:predicted flap endonuclease-1-like 5' DNA nuclease